MPRAATPPVSHCRARIHRAQQWVVRLPHDFHLGVCSPKHARAPRELQVYGGHLSAQSEHSGKPILLSAQLHPRSIRNVPDYHPRLQHRHQAGLVSLRGRDPNHESADLQQYGILESRWPHRNDQLKAHTPAPTQLATINTASPQNSRVRKDLITIARSTIQPRPRTFRIVLKAKLLTN